MEPLEARQLLSVVPTIGIFTAAHEWRTTTEDRVTLLALDVTEEGGKIQKVSFFRDANGDGMPQKSELIRSDFDGANGWTATFDNSAFETKQVLAVATDTEGINSKVAIHVLPGTAPSQLRDRSSQVLTLVAPAVVEKAAGAVDLAAELVNVDGKSIPGVAFFRDADGDGLLNRRTDVLIGIDRDGSNGWTMSDVTANLAVGKYTYFAATLNKDVGPSYLSKYYATATVEITNDSSSSPGGQSPSMLLSLTDPVRDVTRLTKSSPAGNPNYAGISFYYAVDYNGGLKDPSDNSIHYPYPYQNPPDSVYEQLLAGATKYALDSENAETGFPEGIRMKAQEVGVPFLTYANPAFLVPTFETDPTARVRTYNTNARTERGTLGDASYGVSYLSGGQWNDTVRIDWGHAFSDYRANDPEKTCCGGSLVDAARENEADGTIQFNFLKNELGLYYDSKGIPTLTEWGDIPSGGSYSYEDPPTGDNKPHVESQLLLEKIPNSTQQDLQSSRFSYLYKADTDSYVYPAWMDISSRLTGHYVWDLLVTHVPDPPNYSDKPGYSRAKVGAVDIVNRMEMDALNPHPLDGLFGVGWWLDDLDQLYIQNDGDADGDEGVLLVRGDNSTVWFPKDPVANIYYSPIGTHSAMVPNGSSELWVYDDLSTEGQYAVFDATSGALEKRVDQYGNTIAAYGQVGNNVTITDSLGRATVLARDGATGPVTTITTWDGKAYSLAYQHVIVNTKTYHTLLGVEISGGEAGAWSFGYGGTGYLDSRQFLLTSATNPNNTAVNNTAVNYSYDFAGQFRTETYLDGFSRSLTSSNSRLQFEVTGTPTAPIEPVHLRAIKAERKDQLQHTTTYTTNEFGKITSQIDPDGHRLSYSRNLFGQVTSVTDTSADGSESRTTVTLYDDVTGNVRRVTNPDQTYEEWSYSYSYPEQVTAYTDQQRHETTYTLYTSGPCVGMVQSKTAGGTTTYTYSDKTGLYIDLPTGLLRTETDPLLRKTTYDYETNKNAVGAFGRVKKITRDMGTTSTADDTFVQYLYDSRGNQTSVIDELGRRTDYVYDGLNRLLKTIGPYRVDTNGDAVLYDRIVDSPDSGTSWTREVGGGYGGDYLVSPPASASMDWTFNNVVSGKRYEILLTWVANSANTTNAPYTVSGASVVPGTLKTVNQTLSPAHGVLGSRWQTLGVYTATAISIGVTVTNASGRVVADAVRLVEVPTSGATEYQNETDYEYDKLDMQTAVIDAKGNRTQTDYDSLGARERKVTGPDPDGSGPLGSPVTVYGYDRALNSAYTVDPLDRMTTYQYDSSNRQVAEYRGVLIDDSHPTAFEHAGADWTVDEAPAGAYGGSRLYAAGGTANTATWTFSGLVPGKTYQVAVLWPRVTGVPYSESVKYSVDYGGAIPTSFTLNPVSPPNPVNHPELGPNWFNFSGTVAPTGTQITVTLNAATSGTGRVIADAIAVFDTSPTSQTTYDGLGNVATTTDALGNVTYHAYDVLDRPLLDFHEQAAVGTGDLGYHEESGNWITPEGTTLRTWTYNDDPEHLNLSGEARWTTNTLETGEAYDVLVSWQPASGNCANIGYKVYRGSVGTQNLLATFQVDQTEGPATDGRGYFVEDRYYRSLGRYTVSADTALVVQLTVSTIGTAIADRVCVVKVTDSSYTLHDAAGQTTASIDPLGRVSATEFDLLDRPVKSYNGLFMDDGEPGFSVSAASAALIAGGFGATHRDLATGSEATWAFNGLTYDSSVPFELFVYSPNIAPSTPKYSVAEGTLTASTPSAAFLGAGWYKVGTVGAFSGSTLTVKLAPVEGYMFGYADAVCLLQKTGETAYDPNGNVTSTKDAYGRETTYQYDALNRQVKVTAPDPDGSTATTSDVPITETIYDAAGQTTAVIAPYGRVSASTSQYEYRNLAGMEYDALGRQIDSKTGWVMDDHDKDFATTGAGLWTPVTAAGYDGQYHWANVSSPTITATAVWTFTNVIPNREYAIVVSWTEGNANNVPYAITGGASLLDVKVDQRTTPTHPILGRGWQQIATYVPTGTTLTVTLKNAGTDLQGNRVVADAAALIDTTPVAQSTYDANGNVLTSTDALGRVTTYEYDALNRPITTTTPDADGSGGTISDTAISKTVYDAAGQVVQTRQGYKGGSVYLTTEYQYDYLGRSTAVLGPDPTTGQPSQNRKTRSEYDAAGNLRFQYNALGEQTEYVYDFLGRLTDRYDPDPDGETTTLARPHTVYTYDAAGAQTSLTDPAATATYLNTTSWTYDYLGRKVSETVRQTSVLSHTATYTYNLVGDLTKKKDRNDRVIDYAYDPLHRLATETWDTSPNRTMTYTYDNAGRMLAVTDRLATTPTATPVGADYTYTYDRSGNNTVIAATIAGLTPTVSLTQQFDRSGNRTQLIESIPSYASFTNNYTYDRLNRMTKVTQSFSGDANANKTVAFGYDAYSRMNAISRYSALTTDSNYSVGSSMQNYDRASRITNISHYLTGVGGSLSYSWAYDNADRVTSFTSPDSATAATYAYDHTDQLTGATYPYQSPESYTYDENGNRTGGQYQTGAFNRITRDAQGNTYHEANDYDGYDGEGNRIRRISASGLTKVEYGWDHRNRLASVTNYTRATQQSAWVQGQTINYSYDAFDRKVGKTVNSPYREAYVYDGQNVVMQFQAATSGNLASSTLSHGFLYGPAVDQILADQNQVGGTNVRWMLADNLGTIRDVARYTPNSGGSGGVTDVVDHLRYDAFGKITSQTNSAEQPRFTYTARELDSDTGLYYYRARWYDATTGKFMSE
ncbi:MAG: golvesin C-terminal-like domain-containing protein, partial [Pirellulales bacterium]